MKGSLVLFLILGLGIIASGLGVALLRNLFHSVLALALVLILTSALYLTLQAEFVAMVQILLYTGGVVTLVVFAIMLTQKLAGTKLTQMSRSVFKGFVISAAMASLIIYLILKYQKPTTPQAFPQELTYSLAQLLLNEFVFPFEILTLALLAALIGALVLAREEN